ncbi:MAG: DUF418 domain-containing protein [Pontimonas sp.]
MSPHPTIRRDLLPDVLRGFALFGILMVNLSYFSNHSSSGIRGEDVVGLGNSVATVIMITLFQGKFYLLFSFLFGYSSYYVTKGEKAGRPRFALRALVLIALGAIHFTLLWHGDILFLYGVFGLLLLAFMFRSERVLKVWAWVLWGLSTLLWVSLSLLTWLAEESGFDLGEFTNGLDDVMRSGTFTEAIQPRLELWVIGVPNGLLLQGGLAFGAFLVGVLAARKGVLGANSLALRTGTMLRWGFGVGLPLQLLAAALYVTNEVSGAPSEAVYLGSLTLGFMTAPLLSMGYLAVIALLVRKNSPGVAWMRYPGRASLTNYLLQSVFLSIIFGAWGLGLFQALDYWVAMVIAVAVYAVLAGASALWFRRFTQGPMEALVATLSRRNRSASNDQ